MKRDGLHQVRRDLRARDRRDHRGLSAHHRGGYDQSAFEVSVYPDPRNPDHVSTAKLTKYVLVIGASIRGVSENVLAAQYDYEAEVAGKREDLKDAEWAIASHLSFFTQDDGEIVFRGHMTWIGGPSISVMQPECNPSSRGVGQSDEGEEASAVRHCLTAEFFYSLNRENHHASNRMESRMGIPPSSLSIPETARTSPQAQSVPEKTHSIQEPPRRHARPGPAVTRGDENPIRHNRRI